MSELESARAAREARESARERDTSGHTSEALAERAIRLHAMAEELEHEKAEAREEGDGK